ncbi:uncharacterized protein M437DRAFT_62669 [Aureobasidium melanogenum CBS 110374]|uniref:Uncharacterized protein n=1 Tax=Aureobasidium melanogenum (strain CBS 110374) TaxID=1043003 RepID=A0A074W0Z5_AURM1|nr:uncharacterized protein M437DRAFT_62669 [Aureobasidium melanogenum CBS 110374]KEQ66473.1 hypothetical protein M437DRAFT_62669 [Aureobasidium melanogenum CBS 110374]
MLRVEKQHAMILRWNISRPSLYQVGKEACRPLARCLASRGVLLAFVRVDPNFVGNTTTTTSSSPSSSSIIQDVYHYLMLAPYVNIEAFMKEWRSRAPSTHRGFGNQSSAAITSHSKSSALLAINRNPQDWVPFPSHGGPRPLVSARYNKDAARIWGIGLGIFGGVFLIPLIIASCLTIRYIRKMQRQASEEAPRDMTLEQVPVLQTSAQSPSSPSLSSFSLNASSQHPEMQYYGPVDNLVDGMILPNTSGGFASVSPASPTVNAQ